MLEDPLVQNLIMETLDEGEYCLDIIICLIDGKETDEEIADETDLRLNIVRRILYKLYDNNLATYKRSKDPETQWFTYAWKFNEQKVLELVIDKNKEIISYLNEKLDYEESNIFFVCKKEGTRFSFDQASELEFRCPNCDGLMEFKSNEEEIKNLKEDIDFYESSLKDYESMALDYAK